MDQKSLLIQRQAQAKLSKREMEVIRVFARFGSLQATASSLYISVTTLKKHLASARNKLGAKNNIQLVVRAFQEGIISADTLSRENTECL